MDKVIYALRGGPADLGERLRGEVAARLLDLGAHHLTINVVDEHVARAAGLRMASSGRPLVAAVSMRVPSADDGPRAPFDDAVALAGAEVAAYLVDETVPLPHRALADAPLGRVAGMAQVVCFRRRPDLTHEAFLDRWLGHHTQVAIDTQRTFSYVQNVVVRALTAGADPWDAIVEECFPAEAMDDPAVFFDAVGDPDRLARHQSAMFESVQSFIDLSAIDVVPTSRYDF